MLESWQLYAAAKDAIGAKECADALRERHRQHASGKPEGQLMSTPDTFLEQLQKRGVEYAEAIEYFIPRDTRKNRTGKGVMEKAALRLSNECVELLKQIAKPQ